MPSPCSWTRLRVRCGATRRRCALCGDAAWPDTRDTTCLAATENIIRECCSILEADRATLFKLVRTRSWARRCPVPQATGCDTHTCCVRGGQQDPSGKELELMVAEGAKSIFLPVGQVSAGGVNRPKARPWPTPTPATRVPRLTFAGVPSARVLCSGHRWHRRRDW